MPLNFTDFILFPHIDYSDFIEENIISASDLDINKLIERKL
jgi:hypothetical protein|tara:strand:- start:12675 stop:12797 length:123 start_codon:yes stop_codon:yes gene_type:complete